MEASNWRRGLKLSSLKPVVSVYCGVLETFLAFWEPNWNFTFSVSPNF